MYMMYVYMMYVRWRPGEAVARVIGLARERGLPLVIDADGLFLITQRPELIHGYERAVLTPNEGSLRGRCVRTVCADSVCGRCVRTVCGSREKGREGERRGVPAA